MAFVSVATALRAWAQHFGWTGAPADAALFGLAASEIRPNEARLHDAARALRRAFIDDRRGADTDAAAREMVVPFAAGPAAASAVISETSVRDTDMIIDVTRDPIAAALREAFDAGRVDKARELKAMMAALLDALLSPEEASRSGPLHVTSFDTGATEIGDPQTRESPAEAPPPR
jgi:hypothetical protein